MLALAVGLAVAIPALLPPTPGVTFANYNRIEVGMTREEVEAVLGKPNERIDDSAIWKSEAGDVVTIDFDANGDVDCYGWNFERGDERSVLQKMLDRAPLFAKPPPDRRRSP